MRKPSRGLTLILLGFFVLLGYGLRVYDLGAAGIWGDEAFSITLAGRPLAASLAVGADLHPPLYHALLHFWLTVAGDREFAARFPSLIAGVLLIPAVYAVTRRLAGSTAALIAAGLVTVSPFAVYYSQEARMYAQAALFSTLSVYFALRLWESQPSASARPSALSTQVSVLFLLTTLAAMYTHFFSFLVIAAEDVFVLWLWRASPKRIGLWMLGQIALAIAFLPWLIPQIGFFSGRAQARASVLSLSGLLDVLTTTVKAFSLGQPYPDWLMPALPLIVLAALAGLAALLRPGMRAVSRFAVVYLLLPLLLAWLAGPLLNYFNPRFLLLALPAWLALIAAALAWLGEGRGWPASALALAAIAAVSAVLLGHLYTDPAYAKSGYREMMAAVKSGAKPGDVLFLLNPEQTALFEYYGDPDLPKLVFPLPGDFTDARNQSKLAAVARDDRRIWLVMFGNARDWDPGGALQSWLTGHAFRAQRAALIDTQVELYVIGQVEPSPAQPPVDYGGLIRLDGYGVSAKTLAPGDTLQLALAWSAEAKMGRDYTIFTHLIDAQGKVVGQFDGPPMGGAHPTSAWQPGEKNVDRFGILVDPSTPPGLYRLEVGWYDLATLQRIPVLDAHGNKLDDRALLLQIEVK